MAEGLHQFGRTWREALNRAVDIHGLTLLQWAVLDLVRERPGLIQVELATAVGVEGPSLVRVLDGLERQNWVERHIDEHDRRIRRVYLNDQAKARVGRVQKAVDGVQERAVSGMNEEERNSFLRLLGKAVVSLEQLR